MSAESELKRYRDDASRIRSDIAKESVKIAQNRKKAADAVSAAQRSSSTSTIQTKLREAQRAEETAVAAEKKRADLDRKLADSEKKIVTAQTRLERERDLSQKKALDELRRQAQDATVRQFSPSVVLRAEANGAPSLKAYDVFLSHASEDKDEVARPLAAALTSRGLNVWFDELTLKIGHSLRGEIEKGIANARFGVVIISPHFLAKEWTQAELDALFSMKLASGRDILLPVWHHVSKDEVLAASPLLAGLMAANTALFTIDEIADQIAEVASAT
jgi:hypothetical protein